MEQLEARHRKELRRAKKGKGRGREKRREKRRGRRKESPKRKGRRGKGGRESEEDETESSEDTEDQEQDDTEDEDEEDILPEDSSSACFFDPASSCCHGRSWKYSKPKTRFSESEHCCAVSCDAKSRMGGQSQQKKIWFHRIQRRGGHRDGRGEEDCCGGPESVSVCNIDQAMETGPARKNNQTHPTHSSSSPYHPPIPHARNEPGPPRPPLIYPHEKMPLTAETAPLHQGPIAKSQTNWWKRTRSRDRGAEGKTKGAGRDRDRSPNGGRERANKSGSPHGSPKNNGGDLSPCRPCSPLDCVVDPPKRAPFDPHCPDPLSNPPSPRRPQPAPITSLEPPPLIPFRPMPSRPLLPGHADTRLLPGLPGGASSASGFLGVWPPVNFNAAGGTLHPMETAAPALMDSLLRIMRDVHDLKLTGNKKTSPPRGLSTDAGAHSHSPHQPFEGPWSRKNGNSYPERQFPLVRGEKQDRPAVDRESHFIVSGRREGMRPPPGYSLSGNRRYNDRLNASRSSFISSPRSGPAASARGGRGVTLEDWWKTIV
uniref:Uncharacterized protein n=1 Tax=Chromera velia CCMP2878 TaxID=1169474 RepID=A0A0G4H542_9ALVE|eukprot:Cvel_24710.t1-p1 / transcript=Cvel_24710.t1 / gene=Cvel_24710 / organism=Chromera_velia_CCMP2878 / gene_product=hypothetical protein / transcript_product=hypothetical protein / location=Cvel_scaffold2711:6039-7661(+) / protein_length=541 / sequence_SO=supercontig / SO=protein_coding / is_pseudo=false